MKKLVLMLALGMLFAGGAYAQDTAKKEGKERTERSEVRGARKQGKVQQANPEERAARQAEMLSKKLSLSDIQKNQLQALNMKRAQELQALHDEYDTSATRNEAQRAERKAIQERWQTDLKSILDEKQYAAYETDRKEKREKMRKSGREKIKVQKSVKEVRQNQNK